MTSFRGFYINLDRAEVRKRKLQANLQSIDVAEAYERVQAIDGREAGLSGFEACYLSHLKALERAFASGAQVAHIIEDDVLVSWHVAPFIHSKVAETLIEQYDLFYLDMWVDLDRADIYHQAFLSADPSKGYAGMSVLDLRELRVGSMASYLVRREAIGRIIHHLKAWHVHRKAVDGTIDRIVASGALSAGVVVPFLTGIDPASVSDTLVQTLDTTEYDALLKLRAQFYIE